MEGLEANCGLTDAHNEGASASRSALLVMLVGECDVDLRDVVGRVRRRLWVRQHRLPVLPKHDNARTPVARLNRQALVVAGPLDVAVVVLRQRRGHLLLLHLMFPNEHEHAERKEAKEDEDEEGDEEVDHVKVVRGAILIIRFHAADEVLERVHVGFMVVLLTNVVSTSCSNECGVQRLGRDVLSRCPNDRPKVYYCRRCIAKGGVTYEK